MDSFELNKIGGAIVAALLLWFGAKLVAEELYSHPTPKKPGFVVEVNHAGEKKAEHKEKEKSSAPVKKEETKAEEKPSMDKLLASADLAAGEKELKKCGGCHSYTENGKNKVGPKLWGVYERELASVEGYRYSRAMKGKGGKWTAEELSCFLESPKACIKGTKMVYRGIRDAQKRANLIKYISTLK